MDIALIAVTAAGASLLTFFSGFGLGTLLLPVFVLFFPVELAVALTAIVHFLNNIFKVGLIGGAASREAILKFGIPALIFAFFGARFLLYLSDFPIHFQHKLFGFDVSLSPVKIIIGLLLLFFAFFELIPQKRTGRGSEASFYIGGVLSGFFGGLSGHQGALRSAFLIRLGLRKEAFIATGIVISMFVDISRLAVYWTEMDLAGLQKNLTYLIIAVLAAFAGALAGKFLLQKVTLRAIQILIAILIATVGVLLMLGLL